MAYDETFYTMYGNYLREKTVRENHNKMFRLFYNQTRPTPLLVADLGCGLGEYSQYGSYDKYIGVDLNNPGNIKDFVQADYHASNFAELLPFAPTAVVSLFSIECFHPATEKYIFYEKLFKDFPSLCYAFVAGFFYESKRDQETVGETGGIISYQTIENPEKYKSETFSEQRTRIETPSQMFGSDVIEVFKILSRIH